MAAIQIGVTSVSSQLREARHTLRDRLGTDLGLERDHRDALASVANELLGAALDARVGEPLMLSVELFPRLSSVRVRCPSDVELGDEPFGMRERVLRGFAFAWGKRAYTDGSVDLWAEVARPAAGRTAGQ